jgi:hypothetical protein
MRALPDIFISIAFFLLAFWSIPVYADLNLTTNWERPVQFKVVDVESEKPLAQPLLIIKSAKRTESSAEPIAFYDVIKGAVTGFADYRVDENSTAAEVWAIVSGYKLTTHRVLWKELPARQMDSSGMEVNVPTITLALKPVGKASDWQREFRLVIAPELEDLLQLKPPYLSGDEHRAISEFLNRERDRMLGL